MTVVIDCRNGQTPDEMPDISVGEPDWFSWLKEQNSFRFLCQYSYEIQAAVEGIKELSFTAVKQGNYWHAHKRVNGQLRRIHLGRDENLTYETLCETATTISVDGLFRDYKTKKQVERKSHSKACETKDENDELDKLKAELAKLQEQLATEQAQTVRLSAEIERLQSQSQLPDLSIIRDRILLRHLPAKRRELRKALDQFIGELAD
jgi:hypothetical protein